MEALRTAIREGVAAGPEEEYFIPVIGGPRPWFIKRPDLTNRVLHELQHYAETWSNMPLTPEVAYGFRLYRNNSRLHMHVDRPKTHVISFILHIDSSDDAEPWPILIEDLQGDTHEVILTSGDMVFYESSKVFHGRPHTFKGSWYSSIFVHFYPMGYQETFDNDAPVYSIPPHWENPKKQRLEIPLQMHQTGFEEPSCPNGWCATQHSIKWSGPAEVGYWMAPNGQKFPFDPKPVACVDRNYRCAEWANANECTRNPGYMTNICPRSCSTCKMPISSDEL
jgi:ShK domain-like